MANGNGTNNGRLNIWRWIAGGMLVILSGFAAWVGATAVNHETRIVVLEKTTVTDRELRNSLASINDMALALRSIEGSLASLSSQFSARMQHADDERDDFDKRLRDLERKNNSP